MEAVKFNRDELTTILNRQSAKPSTSEPRICRCGAEIEPVEGVIGVNGQCPYPYACRECQAADQHHENLRTIRQNRKCRIAQWKRELSEAIPPLFRGARLGHIATPLRQKMLALPRERGMFLWGPVGSGKSYSLCALARHFIIAGYSLKRVKWDRLCLHIRACYDGNGSESVVIDRLVRANKLIIEDLGSSVAVGKHESYFAVRTLLLLLDERLEQCRATFISSNKPLEEIEKSFDQRIASRLRAMCEVIRVAGTDKRITTEAAKMPSV